MSTTRMGRAFATVGLWTMASRVLGFVRDILIAATLGAGPVAEAFFIAFSLPNLFRRFFAEGAFNMAFVPMFSKKLEAGEDATGFARDAFAGLATVLIGFTLIAQLAMPWLVLAMASGFAGDGRFDMAVHFGQIAFPYILFISLAALASGVLNAAGRFLAAAAAPVLLNIMFIAALFAADIFGWKLGLTLATTVPFAGMAQLALVWVAARRAGFNLWPCALIWSDDLRRLAIIAAPAALAGGVIQINLLVGRQVASFFDGAIVWLNIADRLYQLPLGVVGIAIGVVLLPELSRRLRASDHDGGQAALSRAAEMALALTLPCAVALVVIPGPIVAVLFQRGAFTQADTSATALALMIYAAGLPAFVMQKVLQPLYFAREDTRSPFRFALISMVVNAVAAVGLIPLIGYLAAAAGTSLSAWGMVALLWWHSRHMGSSAQLDARFFARGARIALASVVMGAALWGAGLVLAPYWSTPSLKYLALCALVGLGIATYAIAGRFTGAFSMAEIRAAVKR
jgi:putative peptidoglycan lipid II flippase